MIIPDIRKQMSSFDSRGKVFKDGRGQSRNTREGKKAWSEAINALNRQASVNTLEWNDGLALGAHLHCDDIGVTEVKDHKGSNGKYHRWRASQYGSVGGMSGENIGFG